MAASCEPPPTHFVPAKQEPPIGPAPVEPQQKTAISELMELATKMSFTVTFEVMAESGESHNKNFTMKCVAGEVSGSGSGSGKKKAKQAAAAVVLQTIKSSPGYKDFLFSTASKAALAPHMNSVGRLQEITMKKGWQAPHYDSLTTDGPPHLRQFETAVSVGTLRATGKGKSKKEAKRTAASAMLDNLLHTNLSLQPPAKQIKFTPASGYVNKPPINFLPSMK